MANPPPVLLASTSPRRHELLTAAGVAFDVADPEVDELVVGAGIADPEQLVTTLAAAKANAVTASDGQTVLAADTVVVHEGTILGKPVNRNEARATLLAMSNSTVEVVTAVAVRTVGREPDSDVVVETTTTALTVGPLSPAAVHQYVDSGEADDKAGALAVQGKAGAFITTIEGCYANVLGLPMCSVARLLDRPDIECATQPESS